jgi:hypothetical protein
MRVCFDLVAFELDELLGLLRGRRVASYIVSPPAVQSTLKIRILARRGVLRRSEL